MDKLIADEAGRKQVQERKRAEPRRRKSGSGEGADSALASLRELERVRSQCEPADGLSGPGAGEPARGAESAEAAPATGGSPGAVGPDGLP